MDRQIVYPGAVPLETDLLNTNKNVMVGLGYLMQTILGTNTLVQGLACTQTTTASMTVNVATGSIYSLQNIDNTAYSSLAADTSDPIVKQGIVLGTTQFTLTAPTTVGQSQVYLIEAAYQDVDSNATVLPYYNSSNPLVAYSGPANAGTSNYTTRKGVCALQIKAGTPATTGTQAVPSTDSGWTALYAITVAYGQTTITSTSIALATGAPFVTETLTNKISMATGDARYMLIGASTGNFSESTISTNTSLTATQTNNAYIASAALTLTIAASSTLPISWANTVFAYGGVVTITCTTPDTINGGSVAGSVYVPKGWAASIYTDHAGHIYVEMAPAVLGTTTIASAGTVDLGSSSTNNVTISGTTTITSFGSSAVAGTTYNVTFAGALTLTNNNTSLLLPGGANITTAANDVAIVKALGSGNFQVIVYQPKSGVAVVSPTLASLGGVAASSFTQSIGSNGYQKLPSGLIIQWGSMAVSSDPGTVTFPTTFPTAVCAIQVGGFVTAAASGNNISANACAVSTSGFTTWVQNLSSGTVSWVAIGY